MRTTRRIPRGPRPGGGLGPGTVFAIGAAMFLALAVVMGYLLVKPRYAATSPQPPGPRQPLTPTPAPEHYIPSTSQKPPEEEPKTDEASPQDIWLSVAKEKYEKAEELIKEYGAYETPRLRVLLDSLMKSYGDTPYGPKARKLSDGLAPLLTPRELWVVKGFPNPEWGGLEAVYEPETRPFNQNDVFNAGRWERRGVSAGGHVDLLPGTWQTAYACLTIQSPKRQKVLFSLGTDDTAKLWLNGELIYTNAEPRGAQRGEDTATGELKKGENSVLFKVCQGDGDWGFYIDVAAKDVEFGL